MKCSSSSHRVVPQIALLRGVFLLGLLLLTAAVGKAAEAPYINSWLVLGTFDNVYNSETLNGYQQDFMFGQEALLQPQTGQITNGQTWRYFDDRLFSRNYDNYNDLYSYYKIKQNQSTTSKIAYAHIYVYSPTAQNVVLRVGADTSFKAWVNGALQLESNPAGTQPFAAIVSTPNTMYPNNDARNGGRDYLSSGQFTLNAGWNRLMLKIANREAGRFGFYARLTQPGSTQAPADLTYSTGGASGNIAIATTSMPEANTTALPAAFREWPYIGAQPDVAQLTALSTSTSDAVNGQKPPIIGGLGIGFNYNQSLGMQASPFKFTARGGQAPYSWANISGSLPAGVSLAADGTLSGTPALTATLKNYSFTVRVTDAASQTSSTAFSLTLKERPNRWIEQDRLIALIHRPESLSSGEVSTLANQMKREGYKVGVPITYNNGDFLFRWPSSYANPAYKTSTDVVQSYKTALESQGLKLGMYMGNINRNDDPNLNVNTQILMMEEALRNYQPKVLWCDWLGLDGTSDDSLFSMIKTLSPDTIVLLNGSERMSTGDWDVLTFEGLNAIGGVSWQTWPTTFPWPKKFAPSSWRVSVAPGWPPSSQITTDWREMLRIQLSLIGEGFIADIDHSPKFSEPTGSYSTWPLVVQHENMANWASPAGKPPLHTAYTGVDRGPLPVASYGYNTINTARNAVYILAMQNPRGKTGLPAGGVLAVGPLSVSVTGVTWMNGNAALPFTTQAVSGGQQVTINTSSISGNGDNVATIIKLTLASPLPVSAPPALPAISEGAPIAAQVPFGNIATGKPSWLMSADNSHELIPSSTNYAVYGVDGNPETAAVGGGDWAWSYKVDLQRVATVRRIVAVFMPNLYATAFKVHVSTNGTSWTQVGYNGANTDGGAKTFDIAPTQARFVRIEAVTPNGPSQTGGQMSIAELQVFETNFALGKTASIRNTADTYDLPPNSYNPIYAASQGVDDNLATWAQASNEWAWSYKVDLGKTININRLVPVFAQNYWANSFKIHVSQNGTSWQTVVQSSAGQPGANAFDISTVAARYVMLEAVSPNGAGQSGVQMGVAEMQVFGQLNESEFAFGKPAWLRNTADTYDLPPNSYNPAYAAAKGVDGDFNTWAVASNEWAWSYKVDLLQSRSIYRVGVAFPSTRYATSLKIAASPDNVNWQTVVQSASAPGANIFEFLPVMARYLRVEAVTPDGPDQTGVQMAISELQVVGQ